ncbi:hypothetical protein [Paraliomyxa miuraensis]|uniref:hypothetical protein n=1 Tax=Paraliomyxa miuraensis TaxID=376150 RepID=UPI0022593441|nr:hypothetical protein [Paraliomyxa miuraensis]MCX4243312.1 hypothetical protein [Paraliomyxa miuraensis]
MAWARISFVVLLVASLPACVSNTIELETTEDTEAASSGGTGSATDGPPTTGGTVTTSTITVGPADSGDSADSADEVDGTWGPVLDIGVDPGETQTLLLAIDTIVSPGLPFQGIVWLERDGASTVTITLQWLSLDPGSTTAPRELVGDVYAYPGIPVAPDGAFTWPTGVILVPGAANPITGSDVVLSAVLEAVPEGSPYCGRVSGEVTAPIQVPLDGSTHAMTSVPSEHELPLDFPVTCP